MSPYIIPGLKNKETRNQLIIAAVSKFFNIPLEKITCGGKKPKKEVAAARHIAMYLIARDRDFSSRYIAEELGCSNHTTVLHGLKKINGFISINDETTVSNIEAIKKILNEPV